MTTERRIILEPQNIVVHLTCRQCNNEVVWKLSSGYDLPLLCSSCNIPWYVAWDKQCNNDDDLIRYASYFYGIRRIFGMISRVNEEDGWPVTMRLELRDAE